MATLLVAKLKAAELASHCARAPIGVLPHNIGSMIGIAKQRVIIAVTRAASVWQGENTGTVDSLSNARSSGRL